MTGDGRTDAQRGRSPPQDSPDHRPSGHGAGADGPAGLVSTPAHDAAPAPRRARGARRPHPDPRKPLRIARSHAPGHRPRAGAPTRLRVRHAGASGRRSRRRRLHRRGEPEPGDARRPGGRAGGAAARSGPGGRSDPAHPGEGRNPAHGAVRLRWRRHRVRRADGSSAADGRGDSCRRAGRRAPRRHRRRGADAVPDGDAESGGPRGGGAGSTRHPWSRCPDRPARARDSRSARPGSRRGGAAAGRYGTGPRRAGADRFPPPHDRDDRRRDGPRLRRRDHTGGASERPRPPRRPHRRRVALRDRGWGSRPGCARARHVRLLSGPRRAHVPAGARHRPVQPQAERRSAGAVVSHGDRRRGRCGGLRDPRRHHSQRCSHDVHRGGRRAG